jgi:ankyrin repeat protein
VVNTKLMRYKGLTALQAAAQVGNQTLVERLLDAGADVNAEGCYHNGVTAVYAAAEVGHLSIVRLLVKEGADVEMRAGNKKWTPLQIAIFTGHEEVVEFLKKVEMEKGLRGKGIG